MPSPAIVILVVLGEAGDDSSRLLGRTVQDALGKDAIVLVRQEARPEEDAQLARLAAELHADTVVVVQWGEEDRRPRASLHVFAARGRAWIDRVVRFASDDPPEERSRAVGFGIASMVRTEAAEPASPPPPPPPVRDNGTVAAPAPSPAVRRRPFAHVLADVRLQGVLTPGWDATSLGGEGAIGYGVTRAFAISVRGGLRGGSAPPADATTTFFRIGGGVTWMPIEIRAGATPMAFGARLDVVALRQAATRSDGAFSARWAPAGAALVEGTWSALPRVAVLAGVGAELTFESTYIVVDERRVATLPPVRPLAEVGLRVSFDER